MNQPRMNVYGFPHKGLRNGFSQVSMAAGTANPSDPASLESLKTLSDELFTLLEHHSHAEESVVLPALEAKLAGSTADNLAEHERLEAEIARIKEMLNDIEPGSPPGALAGFYGAFSNFHAEYLAHMAMEEGKMLPLIWDNFSDEELMKQHGRIMASFAPEQILMWFKYIVPALNPVERGIILGGFKVNAPEPFFDSVMAMLSMQMPGGEYQAMAAALGYASAASA